MFARFDPGQSAGVAAYAPTGPTQRPVENRAVESTASGRFPDARPSLLSPERAVLLLVRGSARTFQEVSQAGARSRAADDTVELQGGQATPPPAPESDSRDPPPAEPSTVDLYA